MFFFYEQYFLHISYTLCLLDYLSLFPTIKQFVNCITFSLNKNKRGAYLSSTSMTMTTLIESLKSHHQWINKRARGGCSDDHLPLTESLAESWVNDISTYWVTSLRCLSETFVSSFANGTHPRSRKMDGPAAFISIGFIWESISLRREY